MQRTQTISSDANKDAITFLSDIKSYGPSLTREQYPSLLQGINFILKAILEDKPFTSSLVMELHKILYAHHPKIPPGFRNGYLGTPEKYSSQFTLAGLQEIIAIIQAEDKIPEKKGTFLGPRVKGTTQFLPTVICHARLKELKQDRAEHQQNLAKKMLEYIQQDQIISLLFPSSAPQCGPDDSVSECMKVSNEQSIQSVNQQLKKANSKQEKFDIILKFLKERARTLPFEQCNHSLLTRCLAIFLFLKYEIGLLPISSDPIHYVTAGIQESSDLIKKRFLTTKPNKLLVQILVDQIEIFLSGQSAPLEEKAKEATSSQDIDAKFREAVMKGNVTNMRKYLGQGIIRVNEQDSSGKTIVHHAVTAKLSAATMQCLVEEAHADVDIPDSNGQKAEDLTDNSSIKFYLLEQRLNAAVNKGNLSHLQDVLQKIRDHFPTHKKTSEIIFKAYYIALKKGRADIADAIYEFIIHDDNLILQFDAGNVSGDFLNSIVFDKNTNFLRKKFKKQVEDFQVTHDFLEFSKHANFDIDGDLSHHPMHTHLTFAAASGYFLLLKLCLKMKASVDQQNKQGFNALHYAVSDANKPMVIYLVNIAKAKYTIPSLSPPRQTALEFAVQSRQITLHADSKAGHHEKKEMLVVTQHPAIHQASLKEAKKLLCHIVYSEFEQDRVEEAQCDIADFLLKSSQQDINTLRLPNKEPLFIACVKNNKLKMVKHLRQEFKADVTACDAEGNTSLHHAAQSLDHEMVAYLVTCPDIKPGAKNHKTQTPLMLAQRNSPTTQKKQKSALESVAALPDLTAEQLTAFSVVEILQIAELKEKSQPKNPGNTLSDTEIDALFPKEDKPNPATAHAPVVKKSHRRKKKPTSSQALIHSSLTEPQKSQSVASALETTQKVENVRMVLSPYAIAVLEIGLTLCKLSIDPTVLAQIKTMDDFSKDNIERYIHSLITLCLAQALIRAKVSEYCETDLQGDYRKYSSFLYSVLKTEVYTSFLSELSVTPMANPSFHIALETPVKLTLETIRTILYETGLAKCVESIKELPLINERTIAETCQSTIGLVFKSHLATWCIQNTELSDTDNLQKNIYDQVAAHITDALKDRTVKNPNDLTLTHSLLKPITQRYKEKLAILQTQSIKSEGLNARLKPNDLRQSIPQLA